jgi:hypothetical protein
VVLLQLFSTKLAAALVVDVVVVALNEVPTAVVAARVPTTARNGHKLSRQPPSLQPLKVFEAETNLASGLVPRVSAFSLLLSVLLVSMVSSTETLTRNQNVTLLSQLLAVLLQIDLPMVHAKVHRLVAARAPDPAQDDPDPVPLLTASAPAPVPFLDAQTLVPALALVDARNPVAVDWKP